MNSGDRVRVANRDRLTPELEIAVLKGCDSVVDEKHVPFDVVEDVEVLAVKYDADVDGPGGSEADTDVNGERHGTEGQARTDVDQYLSEEQVTRLKDDWSIDPSKVEGELGDGFERVVDKANATSMGNSEGNGARGELEAIRDAQANGQSIERVTTDARGKTPDYRIDGQFNEVKSRDSNELGSDGFLEPGADQTGLPTP